MDTSTQVAKTTGADPGTTVVTGKARLSYANIWKPRKATSDSKEKFSVSVLIPKSDKVTVLKIRAAIQAAVQLGISEKWGGKKPDGMTSPLKDGDVTKAEDPAYKGTYYVNANSDTPPGIVEKIQGQVVAVTQQTRVYSGCYARVSVNFYPFNFNNMKKGIGVGLNNIMLVSDGEPLSGKRSAEEDFNDDWTDPDEAAPGPTFSEGSEL